VAAAGGIHVGRERSESAGGGIVFLGRVQIDAARAIAAFDQHGAVKVVEHRRGRARARLAQAPGLGHLAGDRIENFSAAQRSHRICAAPDQHRAVRQQGGSVILARVLQLSSDSESPRGGVEDFHRRQLNRRVLAACDQHPAIAQQRCGVMAARIFHGRQLDERAARRIVKARVGNRYAGTGETAREQHSVVVENRRSEAGNAERKAARQGRRSVGREAENLSAGERFAGSADTADDQRLPVGQHRRRVIGARGVKVRIDRPDTRCLRRQRHRHRDNKQQRPQHN
jgi:hypothetical protein